MTVLKDKIHGKTDDTDIFGLSLVSVKVTIGAFEAAQWIWQKTPRTQ